MLFFAPSAVRPNSPVADEQNVAIHHLQQNNQQKPERTTAIPPARIAVLIQAQKQHRNKTTNKTENAKNGEIRSQRLPCTQYGKESHTAIIDPVLTRHKVKNSQLTGKKQRSQSPK